MATCVAWFGLTTSIRAGLLLTRQARPSQLAAPTDVKTLGSRGLPSYLMEPFGALPSKVAEANLLKNMVGPCGLEPQTSTVSSDKLLP
jgi:hypothetical protein